MRVDFAIERWALKQPFVIARETLFDVPTLMAEVSVDGVVGRGEAQGVDYRGETPESMREQLFALMSGRNRLPARHELLSLLPPGGARNALDLALWDLEAKASGAPVWSLAGLPEPVPRMCCVTIGLGEPEKMAAEAGLAAEGATLKLKLGRRDGRDVARATAVRAAVPQAELIVDANGGWDMETLRAVVGPLADIGVRFIEQPLLHGKDHALAGWSGPVQLCADESFDTAADLPQLAGYSAVNIKLDKTGGLTAALDAARAATDAGFRIMLGNMVGTSLAMAPAFLLAPFADVIDLDGPLLLERDRDHPIRYQGALMHPATGGLWG
jgi:L-Ala-D/L-Glu epimerase